MVILICGHPRPGTTLLQRLCDAHPEMAVTNEFGNLDLLGQAYYKYSDNILKRWRKVNGRWVFSLSYAKKYEGDYSHKQNLRFALHHLRYLTKSLWKPVSAEAIEVSYHTMFPQVKVIGDKLPEYIFRLETFSDHPDIHRIVIYRDCLDVISSFLEQVRTTWKDFSWVKDVDNVEKIAKLCVKAINLMDEYDDKLTVLRYETLMHEPVNELRRIADAIGVDTAGFPVEMITTSSIGKHKKDLTSAELNKILEIAGPTMERTGYL